MFDALWSAFSSALWVGAVRHIRKRIKQFPENWSKMRPQTARVRIVWEWAKHFTWGQMLRSWHETQFFDENDKKSNWVTEVSFCHIITCYMALEPARSIFSSYLNKHDVHTSGTLYKHIKHKQNWRIYRILQILHIVDVRSVCLVDGCLVCAWCVHIIMVFIT